MKNKRELTNVAELSRIVNEKLIDYGIITLNNEILLKPYHWININGKEYSHYIINCIQNKKKYFLKVLKENDYSLQCNNYLQQFINKRNECLYPLIIVPPFDYNGIQYYITTFIEGQSLDNIPKNISSEKWISISNKLLLRLNELASIHSPFYSEHNKFIFDNYSIILKDKFTKRFKHILFNNYPGKKLVMAYHQCCKILDNSQFSQPTLIHMDIKPANIIYNYKTDFVTLIDFEFSRFGDIDYGWAQILLSGINSFRSEYKKFIIPNLTKGRLTLEDALKIPKYQCYIFYQLACNLIYYYDHKQNSPRKMQSLFSDLLCKLSKE